MRPVAHGSASALATISDKAATGALVSLAGELGLPIRTVPADMLTALRRRHVRTHRGEFRRRLAGRGRRAGRGRPQRAARRLPRGLAGPDRNRRDRRRRWSMTVHFIGAGPGAADLLTLRGRDLIAACPVCLYAGSLVPSEILAHCPPGARIVNTAALSLDEIMAEIATRMPRTRTSRDCTPAICRSGRRWASSCAACARWAYPIRSRRVCRPLRPPPRRWRRS